MARSDQVMVRGEGRGVGQRGRAEGRQRGGAEG